MDQGFVMLLKNLSFFLFQLTTVGQTFRIKTSIFLILQFWRSVLNMDCRAWVSSLIIHTMCSDLPHRNCRILAITKKISIFIEKIENNLAFKMIKILFTYFEYFFPYFLLHHLVCFNKCLFNPVESFHMNIYWEILEL